MFLRTILAFVFVTLLSVPALAAHCPADAAAIDHALGTLEVSAQTRAQVQQLRDEGMALHNAGNHGEAVDKLAEAMRILLNNAM